MELSKLNTFEERFEYLKLNGVVGEKLFGYNRYYNQMFYRSSEWKRIRNLVIKRDKGCDLGMDGHEIHGLIYVHHINPITVDDLLIHSEQLLDLNNLICTSKETHEAITWGDSSLLMKQYVERTLHDTCPWK